jgi:hypothetical protein
MRIGLLGALANYQKAIQQIDGVVWLPLSKEDTGTIQAAQLDGIIIDETMKLTTSLLEQLHACTDYVLWNVPKTIRLDDIERIELSVCPKYFQPAFALRCLPILKNVRERLKNGEIGNVLGLKLNYSGKYPPDRVFVPSLRGRGIEAVDMLHWLLDAVITEVYAEAFVEEACSNDITVLSVAFDKGAYATMNVSWSLPTSYPAAQKLLIDIVAERGNISVDAFHQTISVHHETGTDRVNWGSDFTIELLQEFCETISSQRCPSWSLGDLSRAIRVIREAENSIAQDYPVNVKITG